MFDACSPRRQNLDISVLIATRRRATLAATLRSLAAMSVGALSWELLVIDNAPVADSAPESWTEAVVDSAASSLPIRRLAEPESGKNRALNRALPETSGSLIVFTDDDVIVDERWLTELWDGAARWPDVSMFGGRVLPRWPEMSSPPGDHPFFGHAYAIADFEHGEGPYSSGYVYGPNMAIRRSIFDAGWRFDTRIGPDGTMRYISGSETSLTVALEKCGHRAVFLPDALVHHQIRPEQLTERWLHGRAFRMGRTKARQRGLSGGWRSVPPELLVSARREYASWLECRRRGDDRAGLDHALAYWTARGMIYECRVTREPPEPLRAAGPGA